MKQLFTFLTAISCIFLPVLINAQGIYQMWGTTTEGGKDDNGAFFSLKHDGTGLTNFNYFTSTNSGRADEFDQPVAYNGILYCANSSGGVNDYGTIAEYNPVTNAYTTKVNFYDVGLRGINGTMVMYNNRFYGISQNPDNVYAVLFEYNPANAAITIKKQFDATTGSYTALPTLYNGKLYGATSHGGNNNLGIIYEFDPATDNFVIKHHFSAPLEGDNFPFTVYAGLLWSIDQNDQIYSFNPATNNVSVKLNMDQLGYEYSNVYGSLIVLNNKMYAACSEFGLHGEGYIFEYDPALNSIHIEMHFSDATVNNRMKLLAYNGLLYGSGLFGGATGYGGLFSFNPVSNAYNLIQSYNYNETGNGVGALLLYNNKMYGWLHKGSVYQPKCTLFEYNPANNQFVLKLTQGDDEIYDPNGQLMYYNHKLYGIASEGGPNNAGGIYAFDLQSKTFELKVPMTTLGGKTGDQGGLLLYNDVFYGVAYSGGVHGYGTLFKYDPNSNLYTKIFDFNGAAGHNPIGQLVLLNHKMYGTCTDGGTSNLGTIFEFNPATNIVTPKVAFGGAHGSTPLSGLFVFHNRLFGTTRYGGLQDDGILFEYLPQPNGLTKLGEFDNNITGSDAVAKLAGYDNKLWGVSALSNGNGNSGFIFQYDLTQGTLIKKNELTEGDGRLVLAGLNMLNHKFYGMSTWGGENGAGSIFEYNPNTNVYTPKIQFHPLNGKFARRTELVNVPAPAAPGTSNACTNANFVNINTTNATEWIAFTDVQGRAVAEINANGNILGNTEVRLYVHDGATRQTAGGAYYLDRNITISTANTPVTPVSVRLYISKTEFESLKATPGAGINMPEELVVYKNNDFCTAQMASVASPLPTTKSDWGFDYVYSTEVTSFSSFYFAKLSGVLPVKILSFNGSVEEAGNKLQWKASCTNDVDFIIERSNDGIYFDSIGVKEAVVADCNYTFNFTDNAPLQLSYYRLRMKENTGQVSYSGIVVLERNGNNVFSLSVYPNPVTGNQVKLKINSPAQQTIQLQLTDISGRRIWNGQVKANEGNNLLPLSLPQLASGMYYLQYKVDNKQQAVKLIKQ